MTDTPSTTSSSATSSTNSTTSATTGGTNSDASRSSEQSTFDQLVAKATEVKDKASSVQNEIAAIETEGDAAGGMVKAVCDGNGGLKSIKIDASLMDGEAAVLEELIVNAVATARERAREQAGQRVSDALGGLPIPSSITSIIAQFLPSPK